ncbi:hypothetical protein ACR77J_07265 [Tissierella praeacuta]|uniref:hypothetical protein n=1 Tax=Tissierella praeacuta TaxID=43131 RepID=UPI003DA2FB72
MYYKIIIFENAQQDLKYFNEYTKDKKEKSRLCELRAAILERGVMSSPIGNIPKKSIRNVMFVPYSYFDGNYEEYMDKQYEFIQHFMKHDLLEDNCVIV